MPKIPVGISKPSIEKGPDYWIPPKYIPDSYEAKAMGNTITPGEKVLRKATIEHCLFAYTYIWLYDNEFWSVPVYLENNFIYLWVYNDSSWTASIVPLNKIKYFMCY